MKETEHECFSRMMAALADAEDAANKMYSFRPDQEGWRQVAAAMNLVNETINRISASGRVKNPGRILS